MVNKPSSYTTLGRFKSIYLMDLGTIWYFAAAAVPHSFLFPIRRSALYSVLMPLLFLTMFMRCSLAVLRVLVKTRSTCAGTRPG